MLQQTYNEECPANRTIYKWTAEFKAERTNVQNDSRPGRPNKIDEEKKKKDLEVLIKDERRIAVKNLSKELNVSVGKCHELLKDLGVRKLCSRFVPYFLTGEMCERRMLACQRNLEIFNQTGQAFLEHIVTEDETLLSLYIPESKRTSAE